MRASVAILAAAVVLPRGGSRGCGEADRPWALTIDVAPPAGDLRVACHTDPDAAQAYVPSLASVPFSSGFVLPLEQRCTLHVYRRDGELWRRSPAHEIEPGTPHVTVTLPPEPVAGIGVGFEPTGDGILVERVIAGTPAAGRLRVGDVVVAVNGTPTAGFREWDFMDRVLGESGSFVALEVGGRGRMVFRREPIGVPALDHSVCLELRAMGYLTGSCDPESVVVDVVPPWGDLRIACHRDPDEAQAHRPRVDGPVFTSGDRLVVSEPCTLHVYRRDGALWSRSPGLRVEPGDLGVTAELPADPVAGVGFAFDLEPDGVHVLSVVPLTPAVGVLRPFDRIVAVDGVSVAGASEWDLLDRSLGPAGSEVVLELAGRGPVRVRRAPFGLDPAEAAARFDEELAVWVPRTRGCYEDRLAERPDLSADLQLEVTIGVDGHLVGEPTLTWSSTPDEPLADCIRSESRRWSFTRPPVPLSAEKTIAYRPRAR